MRITPSSTLLLGLCLFAGAARAEAPGDAGRAAEGPAPPTTLPQLPPLAQPLPPPQAQPLPPPPPPPQAQPLPPPQPQTQAQPLPPPPPQPPLQPQPERPLGAKTLPPSPPPSWPSPWPVEPATKTVRRWYGWQSLIGVIAGDVMAVAGQGEALTYVGITAHVLSGPIVHWSHGHTARGFGSLGLQGGLVAGGFLGGYALVIVTEIRGWPALYTVVATTAAGYVAGPIVDIAALSKETVTVPAEQAKGVRALLPSSVAVLPMVDREKRGLSLVGRF